MTLSPFHKLLPGPLPGTGPPEQGPVGKAPPDRQSAQRLWAQTLTQLHHFLVCDSEPQFLHLCDGDGNGCHLGAHAWCPTPLRALHVDKLVHVLLATTWECVLLGARFTEDGAEAQGCHRSQATPTAPTEPPRLSGEGRFPDRQVSGSAHRLLELPEAALLLLPLLEHWSAPWHTGMASEGAQAHCPSWSEPSSLPGSSVPGIPRLAKLCAGLEGRDRRPSGRRDEQREGRV